MNASPAPPFRVALHNPFGADRPTAERELARRMAAAGDGKGWKMRIVADGAEINAFAPDLVVVLHYQAPKTTPFPTVGCLWNPPKHFENDPAALARTLSYDGFFIAGTAMGRFLDTVLFPTFRPSPRAVLLPSATRETTLPPAVRDDARLFYVGTNWDGPRFAELFRRLEAAGVLAAYGPPESWRHLGPGYAGPLPFDGASALTAANRCGLGLCLHHPDHTEAGLPNMRAFELAAAGALIIAARHPFIDEAFSGCVLTADERDGDLADQILAHVAWARRNPAAATAMALEAQNRFLERFTLDRMMDDWPELARDIRRVCGFAPPAARPPVKAQLVIPLPDPADPHGGNEDAVRRTLAGAADQSCGSVELIIAGTPAALDRGRSLIAAVAGKVAIATVIAPPGPGEAPTAGLRRVDAPWFGVVPPGVELFPNHLAALLETAAQSQADLVYASALTPGPSGLRPIPERPLSRRGAAADGEATPSPAAFLAATGLLDARLLRNPGLDDRDAVVSLFRRLAAKTPPQAAWLVTLRDDAPPPDPQRREALARVERLEPPADEQRRPARLHAASRPAGLPTLERAEDFAALPAGRPVYIYGCSQGGRLTLLELLKRPALTVAGFLDSERNGAAWDLPLCRPEQVPPQILSEATIVIAGQHVAEIADRLRRFGPLTVYNAHPYIMLYAGKSPSE